MIQDLHNHTYYSFCGKDRPEDMVEAAIAAGIEMYGISDHNYGIGFGRKNLLKYPAADLPEDYERTLIRYLDHINLIQEKYADRIRVMRGIEVTTRTDKLRWALPAGADISMFDYCLVENLDMPHDSFLQGDIIAFAERSGCPTGIAHTDLFAHIRAMGEDPFRYLKRLAEAGVFWEMNVSYDSIHHYREHEYMLHFFEDDEQQAMVRESGLRLSVGFDGHRLEDYLPDRVIHYCHRLTELGIKKIFEE